jgi:hypothetical protein
MDKAGSITLSDFKIYYKVVVIKKHGITINSVTEMMEQNRNPQIYCQLIFYKDANNTHWRKESLSNKRFCEIGYT